MADDEGMNKSLEGLLQYSHLGLVMFLIMIAGWYLGGKIDEYFGTTPTGENLGFFVGLIGGFYYMFREIFQLRRELNQEDDSDEPSQ